MILTTSRLLLRPLAQADLEPVLALNTDPAVMRHITLTPQTRAQATEWFAAKRRDVREDVFAKCGFPGLPGWMAVLTRDRATWIGLCALQVLGARHAEAIGGAAGGPYVEVGYRYLPAYWGQGYATEAAAAVVQHGFTALRLPQIVGICDVPNTASNRVLQKLGLTLRKSYLWEGREINFYARERQAPGG